MLVALAGCRRSRELPADLLELVPESAALVVSADLQAVRQTPAGEMLQRAVAASSVLKDLGSEPWRDTDQLLLAASGGPSHLEYLMVVRGRVDREAVLRNAQRRGVRLVEGRRRGHVLYADPSRGGVRLLFPAPGLLVFVSEGWIEPVLRRLAGEGRSLQDADPELAAEARGLAATRGAWLVSRLAPASAQYLAGRSGWPELAALVHVRGALIAGAGLDLRVAGSMGEERSALALEQRLQRKVGAPAVRLLAGGPASVVRRGREVEVKINMSAAAVQNLLSGRQRWSGDQRWSGGLTGAP